MRYSSETKKFFNEEINEQNLPNFVWEILRLYPLVGGFPFYTSKNMEQRKVCIIGKSNFKFKISSLYGDNLKVSLICIFPNPLHIQSFGKVLKKSAELNLVVNLRIDI